MRAHAALQPMAYLMDRLQRMVDFAGLDFLVSTPLLIFTER
ncbi:MAG: hypothetical protein K0S45_2636 [Nitrospira sp.]|jgi:hypothetical protein|nr:hypothetical protein [Nitrospira sp.]